MYKFVDIEDIIEEEERKIQARRMKQYGPAALAAGAVVDMISILFTEFKEVLSACDRIFQLAKALETPQGMVLTGPPGSSKTTLGNYFIKSLPASELFEPGFGAIMLRLRTSPSQGFIVSCLLQALKYPFTNVKRSRVFAMRDVAFEALKHRGTRLVFIDQAHAICTQTRPKNTDVLEGAATDTLREMMEVARVGLVLLADVSFRGLEQVDKALGDRVTVKMSLNYFKEGSEWIGFLRAFCKHVTCVDTSIIQTDRLAAATLVATDGNRRSFKRLIVEAVMLCVQDGQTTLTEFHLKRAFDAVNGNGASRTNPYGV